MAREKLNASLNLEIVEQVGIFNARTQGRKGKSSSSSHLWSSVRGTTEVVTTPSSHTRRKDAHQGLVGLGMRRRRLCSNKRRRAISIVKMYRLPCIDLTPTCGYYIARR
jgi:hypothetical protein